MERALLVPLKTATHRLIMAGYMTNYDLSSLLFAFDAEGQPVASLPVVQGKVCGKTLQALESAAK